MIHVAEASKVEAATLFNGNILPLFSTNALLTPAQSLYVKVVSAVAIMNIELQGCRACETSFDRFTVAEGLT